MQRRWCNAPGFPRARTGIDPLVGQGNRPPRRWPDGWGEATTTTTASIAGHITTRGAVYAFAPSLSGLSAMF